MASFAFLMIMLFGICRRRAFNVVLELLILGYLRIFVGVLSVMNTLVYYNRTSWKQVLKRRPDGYKIFTW